MLEISVIQPLASRGANLLSTLHALHRHTQAPPQAVRHLAPIASPNLVAIRNAFWSLSVRSTASIPQINYHRRATHARINLVEIAHKLCVGRQPGLGEGAVGRKRRQVRRAPRRSPDHSQRAARAASILIGWIAHEAVGGLRRLALVNHKIRPRQDSNDFNPLATCPHLDRGLRRRRSRARPPPHRSPHRLRAVSCARQCRSAGAGNRTRWPRRQRRNSQGAPGRLPNATTASRAK